MDKTNTNTLDRCAEIYISDNLYDYDNEILMKWYPKRIIKKSKKTDSLLELGVGHGFTTSILSKYFERHVALDASPAVIKHFHINFPYSKTEIIETWFEKYSTEEKFDIIVMGFILEHVDNPNAILTQFKKFLKPGGKIFLAVPNAEVMNRRLGYLAGMLSDVSELSEYDILSGHQRYFTINSFNDEIIKAGYNTISMEGIFLKPFTTKQIISLNFPKSVIDALCEMGMEYPELSSGLLAQVEIA